jgi:hypothetical protein
MARMGFCHKSTPHATVSPTSKQLAWAAGFLEGEGSFKKGNGRTEDVECSQVQREPLERLQSYFGGSIGFYKQPNPKHSPFYKWHVSGSRARGVMLTTFALLSPKRKAAIQNIFGLAQ